MMKKLRFLVSLHTRENDFQVAQAQTAEETAHKLGSDVEIVFADNDAVNQSMQLLKAIQRGVESRPDAIVVEPFGGTALPQVARAASAAGIGWAVLNRRPDYLSDLRKAATAPMFAVSSDHFEIGRRLGDGPAEASFDLYSQGASLPSGGFPNPLANAHDVPSGSTARIDYRFDHGTVFQFCAEGSWHAKAGDRNNFNFTANVGSR